MYAVFKYNKQLKSLGKHYSYEEARSAARKFIRKNDIDYEPRWDSTNPSISYFGLSIKQV